MMLDSILLRVLAIVLGLLALTALVVIGPAGLHRMATSVRPRVVAVIPEVTLLVGVLWLNRFARQYSPDVAWIIGFEVTDAIYRLEGNFVGWLQTLAIPELTVYFSRVYVYGYVVLLVFPVLAYLALDYPRPLRTLLVAYSLNYVIGLVFYLLIIAYGPRNLVPDLVDPLLYTAFPEYQTLTRQVNRSINVFPSLHTSLSVTVMFMAWRTRETYPRWAAIALPLGASVVISTMYLGIHWAIDVIAGIILGVVAVYLAVAIVTRFGEQTALPEGLFDRLAGH